jgi:putative transposase
MSQWKVIPGVNIHFATTTIVYWQDIFTSEPFFEVIIRSLFYCIQYKGLHVHGYVIMPNHVHYLLSTEPGINLSDVMRDLKTHTSKDISSLLKDDNNQGSLWTVYRSADFDGKGNVHKVWQDGFHPIAVESEGFFLQKLQYIHENPVRKGFVEKPEHWKYSSARNYKDGDHSIIQIECL